MLTHNLLKLMQREVLSDGEASDDSDPSAKGAPSGGQGHKKRSAVDLAAASLLPTAKAAPDGAAPDLPTGLTSVGLAGDQSRRKGPVAGGSASSADPNEISKRKSGPTDGSDQNIGDRGGSFEGKSGETEEEKLLRLGLRPVADSISEIRIIPPT